MCPHGHIAQVMTKSLLAIFTTTLLLSAAPVAAPVHANSAVLRCQSSDGTLVYTDKACAVFGAIGLPMSSALLTRIARADGRTEHQAMDASADASAQVASSVPDISATQGFPARRSSASGCARTPTQLAMDLRGSLALGDVNRVAESYHWVGMSSKQGERTLDRLQDLIGKPVIDSHYFDAQISMAPALSDMPDAGASLIASNATSIGGGAGVLQLVLGDDAARSVVDLDVHKYAGCYFVKF